MSLSRWGAPAWGMSRDFDPWFGLDNVLGEVDRQMRRMTRDFNRLENQFLGSTGNVGGNHSDFDLPLGLTSLVDRSAILPHIVDQDGHKVAQYNFDIQGFRPEDVNIQTTDDGRLIVSGRHEESSEDHQVSREFRRMVTLPEGTNVQEMKSRLRNDGVLTISAPLPQLALEQQQQGQLKEIPIQHVGRQAIQQGQQQQSQQQQSQQQQGERQQLQQEQQGKQSAGQAESQRSQRAA